MWQHEAQIKGSITPQRKWLVLLLQGPGLPPCLMTPKHERDTKYAYGELPPRSTGKDLGASGKLTGLRYYKHS